MYLHTCRRKKEAKFGKFVVASNYSRLLPRAQRGGQKTRISVDEEQTKDEKTRICVQKKANGNKCVRTYTIDERSLRKINFSIDHLRRNRLYNGS